MEDEAATFGDGAPKPAALPEPPAAAPSAPTLPREPPPIIPAPAPAPVQPVAPVVPVAPPRVAPRRQVLDENVQAVLREEAEREKRARDSERGAIETQPELGLVSPGRAAPRAPQPSEPQPLRERAAPPLPLAEGEDDDAEQVAPPRSARRGLLPDIEQINSTLRATTERGRAATPVEAELATEQRRGFRLGFRTVVLIALALVVIYVMAPTIAARVPTLAPVLSLLVAGMDGVRTLLDRLFTSAVSLIHGHG